MKLSEIKRNPNNPRVIKDDKFLKLKKSIEEFPKMMKLRPMVINSDNVVLGGNMRLKALSDLGYKEIPDEWIKRADELTEDEQRRFIIADNVGFGEHPTMKPVGLFSYQIQNSSKKNDIVIDAFAGSGTTMVACEQLKRKARAIEYDPKYCDVIVNRMITLDPNLTIKRNGIDVSKDWK